MELAISKVRSAIDVSSKMEVDLRSISLILKSGSTDFSTIDFPSPKHMIELINNAYVLSSQNNSPQSTKYKFLRRYLFLIDRHQATIWPFGPANELILLNDTIKKLSETIGVIPRLSHPVVWADQKFLPPEINRKTKQKWQRTPCEKPRRGQTISKNEVHFIGAPREALKENYSATSVERIETSSDDLYLNLIDFDYYKLGLMNADHLLASSSLLDRVQEMIETMNCDPTFAREMEDSIFNDNYFLTDCNGVIVGNYWLYMAYHNSIENLWLLLASDNSAGKGEKDPLTWLSQFEIGQKYLEHLAEEGKYVDKSDILYRVSNGGMSESLKDSFTSWVRESHQNQLLVYQSEARLHQKMRKSISNAGDRIEGLIEMHGNIAVVSTHFFGSDAGSEASSFTSISSSIAEPFAKQYAEAIAQDSETKKLVRDTKMRTREVASEIKQDMKRQRLGT